MKYILELVLVLLGLTIGCMFLPTLIGIFIGLMKFDNGNIFGGIVAIVIGLLVQVMTMKIAHTAAAEILMEIIVTRAMMTFSGIIHPKRWSCKRLSGIK